MLSFERDRRRQASGREDAVNNLVGLSQSPLTRKRVISWKLRLTRPGVSDALANPSPRMMSRLPSEPAGPALLLSVLLTTTIS